MYSIFSTTYVTFVVYLTWVAYYVVSVAVVLSTPAVSGQNKSLSVVFYLELVRPDGTTAAANFRGHLTIAKEEGATG